MAIEIDILRDGEDEDVPRHALRLAERGAEASGIVPGVIVTADREEPSPEFGNELRPNGDVPKRPRDSSGALSGT